MRANKELDAKILIMKDKLEEFEQEKEEWDKKVVEEKEKRLSDAAKMREISVQCRFTVLLYF